MVIQQEVISRAEEIADQVNRRFYESSDKIVNKIVWNQVGNNIQRLIEIIASKSRGIQVCSPVNVIMTSLWAIPTQSVRRHFLTAHI